MKKGRMGFTIYKDLCYKLVSGIELANGSASFHGCGVKTFKDDA